MALYSVLCLLAVIHIGGVLCQNQLQVLPNGTVFRRSLGDSIVFTCRLNVHEVDVENINIQWLNQQKIEIQDLSPGRDNTAYIDKSQRLTNQLYITRIEAKHVGNYYCTAVVEGNKVEIRITLEIFANIRFEDARTPQTPEAFTNSWIICRVTGNPNPTVYWRYRGKRIIMSSRYIQGQTGLQIRNLTKEDNGIYSCCAEVQETGSYGQSDIEVIVHYPPKITKGPGNVEGIQSQEYTLTCKASGIPDPKYDFYKDDNQAPVFSTERIQMDGEEGTIHFRPLHKEDEGTYKCHAFNTVGEDFSVGHLRVLVAPTIYNVKNVTQSEGMSTTLICLSYGDPPPDMTYRKEGNSEDYVMGSNDGGRIILSNPRTGELHMLIKDLVPEDFSNYTCKSRNIAGYHDRNGTVTVNFSPRFKPGADPTVVYNWAGKTRNLTCHVYAEPLPLIEWLRYGRVLRDNETFHTYVMSKDSNLQVTVREVDEEFIYGNYTCRAKNQMGTGEFYVEMRRASAPGPPHSAKVIKSTPTTVLLDIELPLNNGGIEVFGYSVQTELGHIAEFMLGDEYFVEYLRPDFRYNFRIRARNEVDMGQPLDLMLTTPPVGVPYQLVLNCDPDGVWPFMYIATWEKPETGGLPIREYEFKFRRVKTRTGRNGTYEIVSHLEGWNRRIRQDDYYNQMVHYQLDNLYPSSYYQLEVRAMNDIGWSTPNPEFVFRTAEDDYSQGYWGSNSPRLSSGVATFWTISTFSSLLLLLRTCTS